VTTELSGTRPTSAMDSAATDARPTLGLVAAAAGVSLATVSKVLNDREGVAPATRTKVKQLLNKHNYVALTRRRGDHAWLVDLIFRAVGGQFSGEILRGVVGSAVEPVVSAMQEAPDPARWAERLASAGRSGAIIVTSELTIQDRRLLNDAHIPCVLIDPAAELPDPDLPTVGSTNWAGGLAATRHLIELGHRRIAVIAGPPSVLCSRARIDGYRAALESAGLPVDPALIRHGDFQHAGGYEQASTLLALPNPPTAIFAGSDMQAFGASEAARVTGRRIPEDLSIVGFDDLPMSRWVSPPLTTVRQPLAIMGRVAAEMLITLLEGRPLHTYHVELATELIVRSSTASPPRTGEEIRRR
jgi:LacI family transcriptional regulator